MKIYVESGGCSRRLAEFASIISFLKLNNYTFVDSPQEAEYILVTTCAFKKKEEDHSVERVRALRQYNARMLVYGCLPDIAPDRFKEFEGVQFLAPKNIDRIDSFFENITIKFSTVKYSGVIADRNRFHSLSSAVKKLTNEFEFSDRFFLRIRDFAENTIRSSLKMKEKKYYLFICRGCMGKCTYCAIRNAIGKLQSIRVDEIVNTCRDGLKAGYTHFVILGDDVGAYGIDTTETLPSLMNRLIDEAGRYALQENLQLSAPDQIGFHIEEVHPKWMILYEEELLRLLRSGRIKSILCPIQSGNDRILQSMGREHDVGAISKTLSCICGASPDIKLNTQIIIGFPGETRDEFHDTLEAVNAVRFDEVTIFPFDLKENTRAAEIEPRVSEQEISSRIDEALKYFRKHKIRAHLSCQL